MATLRKSLRTIKIQPLYYFKLIKYERTSYKPKFITDGVGLSRLYKNFLPISAECPQRSRRFVRRVPLKYAILKLQNQQEHSRGRPAVPTQNVPGLWHPTSASRLNGVRVLSATAPTAAPCFHRRWRLLLLHSIARPTACGSRDPPQRIICFGNCRTAGSVSL